MKNQNHRNQNTLWWKHVQVAFILNQTFRIIAFISWLGNTLCDFISFYLWDVQCRIRPLKDELTGVYVGGCALACTCGCLSLVLSSNIKVFQTSIRAASVYVSWRPDSKLFFSLFNPMDLVPWSLNRLRPCGLVQSGCFHHCRSLMLISVSSDTGLSCFCCLLGAE